jgi:Zn ribbon nucleic-acid-binding protein
MTRAHLLDGLCCAECRTDDSLWLDSRLGVVECAECGCRALVVAEFAGGG